MDVGSKVDFHQGTTQPALSLWDMKLVLQMQGLLLYYVEVSCKIKGRGWLGEELPCYQ